MTHFIKIGGISIVTAVFGIFLFILIQILPLFRDAKVQPHSSIAMPPGSYEILGIDEWGELPFVVDNTGKVHFISLATQKPLNEGTFPFAEEKRPILGRYKPETRGLVYAFDDGTFSIVAVSYSSQFDQDKRTIVGELQPGAFYPIGEKEGQLLDIDYGDSGTDKLVAAIQD